MSTYSAQAQYISFCTSVPHFNQHRNPAVERLRSKVLRPPEVLSTFLELSHPDSMPSAPKMNKDLLEAPQIRRGSIAMRKRLRLLRKSCGSIAEVLRKYCLRRCFRATLLQTPPLQVVPVASSAPKCLPVPLFTRSVLDLPSRYLPSRGKAHTWSRYRK